MDSTFQAVVQGSTFLDESTRMQLLNAASALSPDQVQKLIVMLQQAEKQKETVLADLENKKQSMAQDYAQKLSLFFKHTVPSAMRTIEEKDRSQEDSTLDSLLSDLNKL